MLRSNKRIPSIVILLLLTSMLLLNAQPTLAQGQAGTTLSAEKTAAGHLTRTWQWTLNKSVTPATWNLFRGDSGTSQYTITATRTGYQDAVSVDGEICVTNGGDRTTENLKLVDQVEYKIGSGQFQPLSGATQTIIPAVQIGPGQSQCYPYEIAFTPVAGATYRNVVKVTITNHSGHLGEEFGPEPKAGFTVPTTPDQQVDASITVNDTNGGSWVFSGSGSVNYPRTFTCDANRGTHNNTASAVTAGGTLTSSASVTVNCYALNVTKDADTSFNRKFTWDIDKVGKDPTSGAELTALTLSLGQTFDVEYDVTVSASYQDQDFAVSGNIWVNNPAPMAATISSVSDVLPGASNMSVVCGVSFPYTLAAGGTLSCTYSADLPDASARTNTATAVLQNYSYSYLLAATAAGTTSFSGTAGVSFSGTPDDLIDECITVDDTHDEFGDPVQVCYNQAPKTFTYQVTVGPYEVCGMHDFDNTASFVTNDTQATGSDTWQIDVNVPCGGCTLTPGYWKTHSEFGPAPYDDTWALISGKVWTPAGFVDGTGAAVIFFYNTQPSQRSYYNVLWTPPKGGNAYFILAHAYIAAELNFLNGAYAPPAVQTAFNQAKTLFETYTPDGLTNLRGKNASAIRSDFLSLAGLLDSYNNGEEGVPHCDEQYSALSR